MAALQKAKLLAIQCAAASSPARVPPSASAGGCGIPGILLRRRKSLRGFLWRRKECSGVEEPEQSQRRGTLRDLFVSSSPPRTEGAGAGAGDGEKCGGSRGGDDAAAGLGLEGGSRWRRLGMNVAGRQGFPRFGSRGLRYRLLRRTWRPVLVTIPE